jgi:hypothetical protein
MAKATPIEAEFEVPREEAAGLNRGRWIWEVSAWPGVRSAALSAPPGHGTSYLTVTATKTAMKRIRAFCDERGFEEVTNEDEEKDFVVEVKLSAIVTVSKRPKGRGSRWWLAESVGALLEACDGDRSSLGEVVDRFKVIDVIETRPVARNA